MRVVEIQTVPEPGQQPQRVGLLIDRDGKIAAEPPQLHRLLVERDPRGRFDELAAGWSNGYWSSRELT